MTEKATETSETELESEDSATVPFLEPGIGTRIEQTVNVIGSRSAAAKAAGVSTESLRRYVHESAKPTFESVVGLARAAGVSLAWLATGRGAENPRSSSISDEEGNYAIYKVSGRIEPDIVRDAALVVERRLADQPPELRADTIVDLATTMQRQRDKDRAEAQEMLSKGPPGQAEGEKQ